MGVMGNIYITLIIPIPPITLNLWSYSVYNTCNLQQLKQQKKARKSPSLFHKYININYLTGEMIKLNV